MSQLGHWIQRQRGCLWKNCARSITVADALGMSGRPLSSIFPVVVGENDAALAAADALLEQGFLAPAIRYPTVPRGTARLRITVTAAHESGQVTRLGTALKELLHGK